MVFGGSAFGSAAIGGSVSPPISCLPISCNLIVMEQLLKIGYTYDDILRLYKYIGQI